MDYDNVVTALDMLYVAKLFYDREMLDALVCEGGLDEVLRSPEDYYYEFLYTAGLSVFGAFQCFELDDYGDESGIRFSDPVMTRFYKLCRKYQKLKGVSKKRNPFLIEANAKIREALTFNSWCYDYRIHANPKKRDGCALIFFMSPEFYFGSEVIFGFFELLEFYKDGVRRLEEAIKAHQRRPIPFPAPMPEGVAA